MYDQYNPRMSVHSVGLLFYSGLQFKLFTQTDRINHSISSTITSPFSRDMRLTQLLNDEPWGF